MQINNYLAGMIVYGMRVLIVEDEDFHAEVLEKMLRVLGFKEIDHVRSGEEALTRARRIPYHLVISDLQMPGMDGTSLISQLRYGDDPTYQEVPLIMLTCNRDAGTVQRSKEAGATDFLAKPFDIATLRRKIVEAYVGKPHTIFSHHKKRFLPTESIYESSAY